MNALERNRSTQVAAAARPAPLPDPAVVPADDTNMEEGYRPFWGATLRWVGEVGHRSAFRPGGGARPAGPRVGPFRAGDRESEGGHVRPRAGREGGDPQRPRRGFPRRDHASPGRRHPRCERGPVRPSPGAGRPCPCRSPGPRPDPTVGPQAGEGAPALLARPATVRHRPPRATPSFLQLTPQARPVAPFTASVQ